MKSLEKSQFYSGYILIEEFDTFAQPNLSLPVTIIFKFTIRKRIYKTKQYMNIGPFLQ